jgi:predicted acyltransferase
MRNAPLDILRGLAIFGMILSGTIAFDGVLPAWMYHAQSPPPTYAHNNTIAGITWVDVVFPTFLFALGMAIPFTVSKVNNYFNGLFLPLVKRYLLLLYFAYFYLYMRPFNILATANVANMFSLLAFIIIIAALVTIKKYKHNGITQFIALASSVVLLGFLGFNNTVSKTFSFQKSDIIIVVLANMAFFGTTIYYFTRNNWWARVAVLPVIMAIFLSAATSSGWQKIVFEFGEHTPINISYFYKFYFLKYLFIVLPATIIGDILLQANNNQTTKGFNTAPIKCAIVLLLGIVVLNLYCLFTRLLVVNLITSIILLGTTIFIFYQQKLQKQLVNLLYVASYLLLLGLCFEAYQGGIKKDSSTYSYYFVTGGLAILLYVFFYVCYQLNPKNSILSYLEKLGQNSLLAYMLFWLFIVPTMHFLGIKAWFDALGGSFVICFLRGFLVTFLIGFLTNVATAKKIVLKT